MEGWRYARLTAVLAVSLNGATACGAADGIMAHCDSAVGQFVEALHGGALHAALCAHDLQHSQQGRPAQHVHKLRPLRKKLVEVGG